VVLGFEGGQRVYIGPYDLSEVPTNKRIRTRGPWSKIF
jgi:hypothetical protein